MSIMSKEEFELLKEIDKNQKEIIKNQEKLSKEMRTLRKEVLEINYKISNLDCYKKSEPEKDYRNDQSLNYIPY